MTFGFKTSNDAGFDIIDSDHVTLAVLRRGQFGAYDPACASLPDNRHGVLTRNTYSSPITSQSPPLVAFVPRTTQASGHWHCFHHTGGPGNWTGFVVSFAQQYPGQTVSNYYTFQAPTALPYWDYVAASPDGCQYSNEVFGMRVWNELGQLAFDSATPIMKIIGQVNGWTPVGNYPQWRSYVGPWPYPIHGDYGFLASNLPQQAISASYAPYISVRYGFSPGNFGSAQIGCTIGGADRNSEEGIYAMIDSNQMPDDILPNWINLNPINMLAVRVK